MKFIYFKQDGDSHFMNIEELNQISVNGKNIYIFSKQFPLVVISVKESHVKTIIMNIIHFIDSERSSILNLTTYENEKNQEET